jgi:hypothetical protein
VGRVKVRTLSTRELAAQIATTEADVKAAFERVTYWTREGILTPYGEANPGTGRSRVYAEEEVKKARVFDILTAFGIGIKTLKTLTRTIDYMLSTSQGRETSAVLVLEKVKAGDKMGVQIVDTDKAGENLLVPLSKDSAGILVINLGRVWRV